MCKWGTYKDVEVFVQPELSHTGKGRWCVKKIDSCIANIVDALQSKGINMTCSCCGHGKSFGEISLQDGRTIIIIPDFKTSDLKMKGSKKNKVFDLWGDIRKLLVEYGIVKDDEDSEDS